MHCFILIQRPVRGGRYLLIILLYYLTLKTENVFVCVFAECQIRTAVGMKQTFTLLLPTSLPFHLTFSQLYTLIVLSPSSSFFFHGYPLTCPVIFSVSLQFELLSSYPVFAPFSFLIPFSAVFQELHVLYQSSNKEKNSYKMSKLDNEHVECKERAQIDC